VESLARPGRNITGLATITYEVGGKYLELLLAMAPKVSRVAFLSEFRGTNPMALKNIQAAGQRVGVTILPHEALSLQEIESVFSAMRKQNAQGLIIASTPIFYQQRRRIAELALAHRMPYVASYREYTEAGGLVSYGPSLGENYRRAATFVDKIFKGAKPADLPVEQPTTFELVINRMTAKALGLAIPKSLLISADTVIE
jgi:putative ABC transport system substrate-binding protein